MKTIAQQLNVKDFPFEIKDKNGNQIYRENSSGFWIKRQYDTNGNKIRYEDSCGVWKEYEYDFNGNIIRYDNSYGYWIKYEYDSNGEEIYREDSTGHIIDKRPAKTCKNKIVEIDGKKYKLTEI